MYFYTSNTTVCGPNPFPNQKCTWWFCNFGMGNGPFQLSCIAIWKVVLVSTQYSDAAWHSLKDIKLNNQRV